MKYFQDYSDFEQLYEREGGGKGFFASTWSILTLGGYLSTKFKNIFGIKSVLVKNKVSQIDKILSKSLVNLASVLPSERVLKAEVDRNPAFRKVKIQLNNKKISINTYNKLFANLKEIEEAIMTYVDNADLNLIKEEVEKNCDIATSDNVIIQPLSELQHEIKSITKDLRFNEKIVHALTQKMPRYDLKNISLEVYSLCKKEDDYKKYDDRLLTLWHKLKNKLYSKYEKYYTVDDLNNWLDFEHFDPKTFKYIDATQAQAKRSADALFKTNNISEPIPVDYFKPTKGEKFYVFFDENYERRALLLEMLEIDNGIQICKPYGFYQIKKSDSNFKFNLLNKRELKGSLFANVDTLNTVVYVYNKKMFFIKGDDIFTKKDEKPIKLKDLNLNDRDVINNIMFDLKRINGVGIFLLEDKAQFDTNNWQKYTSEMFNKGLEFLKKNIIPKIKEEKPTEAQPDQTQPEKEEKAEAKGGFKIRKLKVADEAFFKEHAHALFADLSAVSKTTGLKFKEEQIKDFIKKFSEKNSGKLPNDYEKVLSAMTHELLKRAAPK